MIKKTAKDVITIVPIFLPLPFMLMLDISLEIYHHICFPIYGIKKVNRKDYIEIRDRGRLQYLSLGEKIGCVYCGYANGLAAYFKEIANRTEAYRCPIIHQRKMKGEEHQKSNHFAPYGDEKKYKN